MCRVVVHVEYQFSDVLPCDSNVAVRHHQNSVTISRRPQGDLVHGVSRQSVQRKRVECRQETRTGNTAVGYRRTGRKMLRRRGPRRNHRIGKSEDPSDPSDDHAYSPPMIQYSPKSNALVHWRQTLSTHCHRGQPYMHALCAVVINHYECPKQIAFFEKYKCRKLLAFSIIN